jgi:hypothetical protein
MVRSHPVQPIDLNVSTVFQTDINTQGSTIMTTGVCPVVVVLAKQLPERLPKPGCAKK